jgi:uncharacterized repeat protein (TIGR01451 family)
MKAPSLDSGLLSLRSAALALFVVAAPPGRTLAQPASSLDHFSWPTIVTPQQAGRPFLAMVQARDSGDNPFSGFNGTVALREWVPGQSPGVLITEIETINAEGVELSNVSPNPVDFGGWRLVLYDAASWPAPKVSFAFPAGAVCPAYGVFQVRDGGVASGVYPVFSTRVDLSWSNSTYRNQIAVLLLDASGNAVDFFCAIDAYPDFITVPMSISQALWSGLPLTFNTDPALTYQRVGHANHNSAGDWVLATNSFGAFNAGLNPPFLTASSATALVPASAVFTNGLWSGQVVATMPGTNVVLRADDELGAPGDSSPLTITALPVLVLEVPPQAFKASPGLAGQGAVEIPAALWNDLTVALSSSLPSQVAVPSEITVPAGSTSASFGVTNFDDGLVDGPVAVTVSATAAGFAPASAVLTNFDRPPVALSLSLPTDLFDNQAENADWQAGGTVSSSAFVSQNVAVRLASSDTDRCMVPDFVIIPAGQRSAQFGFTLVDTALINSNQPVTISASVPGWEGTQAQAMVIGKNAGLTVGVPAQINSATGLLTNASSVSLAGILATNVMVGLTSSAPSQLQVPETVVIPAGQTTVMFNLYAPAGPVPQGDEAVTVTASAVGFASGTAWTRLIDQQLTAFSFSPLPLAEVAGQPFLVTVSALTASGWLVPAYSGTVKIYATNSAGPLDVSPSLVGPFTNGLWTGMVTVAGPETQGVTLTVDDGSGHAGSSAPFGLVTALDLNLPVADMLFDASRGCVWAAIQEGTSPWAASVVSIDPLSGAVSRKIALGQEPGKLALSSDGQLLYVALAGGGLEWVDLSQGLTATPLPWPFGAGTSVSDMVSLPGNPLALVAQVAAPYPATALYLGGILETNMAWANYYAPYNVQLAPYDSPTNFYSVNAGELNWLNVVSNGLVITRQVLSPQDGGSFVYAGGLLFSTSGAVYRPSDFLQLGAYAASGLMAVDTDAGEVFFLSDTLLQAFDLPTFAGLGQLNLPIADGSALQVLCCGSNVLAVSTSQTNLLLVRTALVRASAAAEISIAQSVDASPALVGSNVTYSITVSNAGPETAMNAVLTEVLPANTALVAVRPSQGAFALTHGILSCSPGPLTNGAVAVIRLTLQPLSPGQLVNSVWITHGGPNATNLCSSLTNTAVFGPVSPAVTCIAFNSDALVYDSARNCLWAATERFAGALNNSLRSINLSNGLSQAAVSLVHPYSKIALSADQNYLYALYGINQNGASYTPNNYLQRVNLVSNVVDEDVLLMDSANQVAAAVDLVGIAAYPSGIVVSKSEINYDASLYQDGVMVLDSLDGAGGGVLEVNRSIPTRCYRLDGGYIGNLARLEVGPQTIRVLDNANLFGVRSWTTAANFIRFGAGLLFADNGMVVDPEAMVRVTQLPVAGLVATDPGQGKVFYLSSLSGSFVLQAFDIATFRQLWSAAIPNVSGTPGDLVQCGSGLLAFRTSSDQLFVVNTMAFPNTPLADLAVVESVSANPATPNAPVLFTTTVSNAGPDIATGVLLSNSLPAGASLASFSATQGTCTNGDGWLICQVGALDAGASAGMVATLFPAAGTTLAVFASATLNEQDPNPANNTATAVTFVPGTTTGSVATLQLTAADLVYDPFSRKIYASVPASAALNPNSVMSIDPVSGAIGSPVPVGNGLGKLAVSDDGQYLYAALNWDSEVVRLRLSSLAPDLRFCIGNPMQIQDMAVLPGSSHAVAIDRLNVWGSPLDAGLVIYDDGIPRPRVTSPPTFSDSITFSDSASTLYAFENEDSGFVLWTEHLDASGVASCQGTSGLISGSGVYIKYAGGRVYASSGTVVDLHTMTVTGQCYGSGLGIFFGEGYGTLVEPDPDNGRIYYLAFDGAEWQARAYDAGSFQPVGSLCFPNVIGTPSSFIRWGDGGLAFSTSGGQVFLFPRSLVRAANLAISLTAAPSPSPVGAQVTYTLSVTNRGPGDAHDVTLTQQLPANASFVTATSPNGACALQGSSLTCPIGTLPGGGTASVTVVVTPPLPGLLASQVNLTTSDFDPDLADCQATLLTVVTNTASPGPFVPYALPASDIAYDPIQQRLLASIQSGTNVVVGMDPASGEFTSIIPVGTLPGQLALSDDGQYLYTALMSTGGVGRINLASNLLDLTFPLGVSDSSGNYTAGDLQVAPGQAATLAVSINHGGNNESVTIYDDGLPRSNSVPATSSGGTYFIRYGADASTLYSTLPGDLRLITVDASGARLVADVGGLVPASQTQFEFDAGRIYLQSGTVIDPTSETIVSRFPAAGPVAPDPATGRICFVTGGGTSQFDWQLTVRAFDVATTNELWSVPLPAASGYVARLVNVGTNGFAVLTDANLLFVVRMPPSAAPTADLAIQQTSSIPTAQIGGPLTYALTINNLGPWTASGVVVSNPIPIGADFVSASATQGSCVVTNGSLVCALGSLTRGATATVRLQVVPQVLGSITNSATITGNESDPDLTNNSTILSMAVNPEPSVSVSDTMLAGDGWADFLFTLSAPSSETVSVGYATANGTAIAGIDYSSAQGVVSFPPGSTSISWAWFSYGGSFSPTREKTFSLNLTSATNAHLGHAEAVVTLVEAKFYTVAIAAASVESHRSATNAVFGLTLSPRSPLPVTVSYQTVDGTAVAGVNYVARVGSLLFEPAITNLDLSVPVLANASSDGTKTFSVVLGQPEGAVLGTDEALGTIIYDAVPEPPEILDIQVQASSVRVQFNSTPGRFYRMESCDSLGSGSWTTVADRVPGTGNLVTVPVVADLTAHECFYRILLLP